MSKVKVQGALALVLILGGYGAQAQTPIPPSPKDFVLAASQADHYQILAATVALTQSQDVQIRSFAEEMIKQHTRLDEDLRRAALASGLPPPEQGISSDQALLLGSLQSARGSYFDKVYARQQMLIHAQAIAVDDSFATTGADPNLRMTAQSALPSIREHLKSAEQLRTDVGPG